MEKAEINITEETIIISSSRSPLFLIAVLGVLTIIAVSLPIISSVMVINMNLGFKFGHLIFFLICFAVAVYFTRLILWNLYGKEIIILKEDGIEYHCSYKYFVDNKVAIELGELEVYPSNKNQPENTGLTIFNGSNSIETSLNIRKEDLERIENKIKTRYNRRLAQ